MGKKLTAGGDQPALSDPEWGLLKQLAKGPQALSSGLRLLELGLATNGELQGRITITPLGRRAIAHRHSRYKTRRVASSTPLLDRDRIRTVADMQKARWKVIVRCPRCKASRAVDLGLIAWRRGGRTSLWDETPSCLTPQCHGPAAYLAAPPGVMRFQPLA